MARAQTYAGIACSARVHPGCGVQLVKPVSFLTLAQGLDLVKRFRRSWRSCVLFPTMRVASSLVQHRLGAYLPDLPLRVTVTNAV